MQGEREGRLEGGRPGIVWKGEVKYNVTPKFSRQSTEALIMIPVLKWSLNSPIVLHRYFIDENTEFQKITCLRLLS